MPHNTIANTQVRPREDPLRYYLKDDLCQNEGNPVQKLFLRCRRVRGGLRFSVESPLAVSVQLQLELRSSRAAPYGSF